ncbi:MAG: putative Ig domain-containing protein, partial [Thermofilum sp.]
VAQTTPYTLTVQPDRPKYGAGFLTVTLSGNLKETGSGNPVSNEGIWLRVEDPSGNLKYFGTPMTDNSGNYSAQFQLSPNLDPVGTYRVIAAYHPGAEEVSSFVFELTPPSSPSGLSAQAGKNSVSLTWNGVSDSDLAGYNVYRSSISGSGYQKIGSSASTSYVDTTASASGNPYYYVVTAYDDVGNESGYSNEASATPWGDLNHFTFGAIGNQVAGIPFSISISAYDAYNQIVQDFTGPATISGFDGTVQPTSISFSAGVANPQITITKAKTDHLTIAYGSVSNDSNNFTVSPSAVTSVSLSPKTATITAGTIKDYFLWAFDSYGNTWDVSSSASFAIDSSAGGSWSANHYTSEKAGIWTVTASYGGFSDSATLEVLHASTDHLVISPKTATILAGRTQEYSCTAYDAYGNSWDVTSSAEFFIDSGAGGTWVDNHTYRGENPGLWTVTASIDGKTDTASLRVGAIPVISSTDIQGPYLVGHQQEFHVSVSNANGLSYSNVLFHFRIQNTSLSDIASFQYWEDLDNQWHNLPLTQQGSDLVGYFGPPSGFPMPSGYTATSTFRITLNTAKDYPFQITLEDLASGGYGTLATFSSTASALLVITTESLPVGGLMVPYSATLTAAGATGTISWSCTGTVPAGLSLNSSTGVISGTPEEYGTFTITVNATYNSHTVSKTLILVIDQTPIEITEIKILDIYGTETSTFYPGEFYQVQVKVKNTIDFPITNGMVLIQSKCGDTILNFGSLSFVNLGSGEERLLGSVGFLLPNSGYTGIWYVTVASWSNWAHAGGIVWSAPSTAQFVLSQ